MEKNYIHSGIGGERVVAMIHDQASVNSVPMKTISVLYTAKTNSQNNHFGSFNHIKNVF